MPTLERLIGDAARFLREHWGRRSLLRRAGASSRSDAGFDDLLTVDDVDRLVASTQPHVPDVNLIQDGLQIDVAEFSHAPDPRRGGARVVDAARVYEYFHAGATIQMQGIHFRHAPLAVLCRQLEIELAVPVQANLYVTPPASRGLALHSDRHDVLVLQVAGTKHWRVFEPVPRGTDLEDLADEPPLNFEAELARGDVLYLPRGVPHSVASTTHTSIHLTIGLVAPTWREVVDDLVAQVLADIETEQPAAKAAAAPLDANLPAHFALDAGAAIAAQVAVQLRRLADRLVGVDPAAAADRIAQRFWSERMPVLHGQLGQLMRLEDIGLDTRFVRPTALIARVMHDSDGRLVIVTGDRSLSMPAELAPAIAYVLGRDTFTAAELNPFLEAPGQLVLLRRLVREGILAQVSGPTQG